MTKGHSGVNKGRLIAGGVAAGVVQFILEGVINSAVLGNDWKAWAEPLKGVMTFPSEQVAMTHWFIQSILLGLVGMWIYTGFRARCGAGPKTAACTGVALWLASWVSCFLNNSALGVTTCKLLMVNMAAGLPVAVLSMLVGAWLYRE